MFVRRTSIRVLTFLRSKLGSIEIREVNKMGQNRLKIFCNPYSKKITIQFTDKDGDDFWKEISDSSDLNKFTQGEKSIQNCGKELVDIAQKKYNLGTAGLGIVFCGTKADYADFESIVNKASASGKKLSLFYNSQKTLPESIDAVRIIDESYEKVKKEFEDYILGSKLYDTLPDEQKKIGEAIEKYNDIKKSELNICVIGTYSSGKSTFINALIGAELLPKDSHPTTAKATKIHSSDELKLCFTFAGECISIVWENGQYRPLFDDQKVDQSIKSLMALIDLTAKDKKTITEQMNAAISVFNLSADDNPDYAEFLNKVDAEISVFYPFRSSGLNNKETQFTILDTPGSNSKTFSETHLKVLSEAMKEQTNSLPIFVIKNDQLDTTDNAALKASLDKYKNTFDNSNMLLIINQADEIELPDLKKGVKKEIAKNWESVKILYVASIIGIGSKKENEKWIYEGYYQKFDGHLKDFLCQSKFPTQLYPFAVIPDDDKRDIEAAAKNAKDDYELLYHNSGLYAVEYEISKYADKYLLYLKARERNQHLLTALRLSEEVLSNKKDELKQKESEYVAKREAKKTELKTNIEACVLDELELGKVIDDVEKEFFNTICSFKNGLKSESVHRWTKIKNDKGYNWYEGDKKTEKFHEQMVEYINEFYKEIFPKIKKSMEPKFNNVADLYKQKIIDLINGDEELSDIAKEKIFKNTKIFDPEFSVSYLKFKDKGAISEFLWLKWFRWIDTDEYSRQLKNMFDERFLEDCINCPNKDFRDGLIKWKIKIQHNYVSNLDAKSLTLKDFDAQIGKMREEITELQSRINNLCDVKSKLQSLLEFKEL